MFRYHLRVSIAPDEYAGERIRELVRVCRKYGYDEVMFFINAENLNVGHMTLREAQPYIDVIKRAKAALSAENIATSLNIWNTLLGIDRGRTLKEGQNFTRMQDMHGLVSTATACPLCENFRSHFAAFYLNAIAQIRPKMVWIEDDFRLHNHIPLDFGGCFCDLHMQKFCDVLGKQVSREEFFKGVVDPAYNAEYRMAWLTVARDTMLSLAEFIGRKIAECGIKTKVGLMSSAPEVHCIEYRDWHRLLSNLTQGGEMTDRIHLPCYLQTSPQQYCWDFQYVSMLTRAFLPKETHILPELENGMFSRQTKSANFTRFMVESSAALGVDGCTLDMDCFCGGGAIDAFGYGPSLAAVKRYLSRVSDLKLDPSSMRGIVVPVSPCSSATLHTGEGKSMWELLPYDFWWGSQLACMGIAYTYSTGRSFKGKIVAVGGQWLRNLTEEEIRALFRDNFVILNANAAEVLFDLGLESCIGAKSMRRMPADSICYSYERAEGDRKYLGIPGAMAGCYSDSPDAAAIEYEEGAERTVYSALYDHYRRRVADCTVAFKGRALIFPYFGYHRKTGTLHTLRDEIIKAALAECAPRADAVWVNEPCVTPYYFRREGEDCLFIVNFSDDSVAKPLRICGDFKDVREVRTIDRKSGRFKTAAFTADAEGLELAVALPAEQTAAILIKRGE